MTLTLVRMGLPNSIALLALAVVPIVAMVSVGPPDAVRSDRPATTVVAALDAVSDAVTDEAARAVE
jgi:hypothetical protein